MKTQISRDGYRREKRYSGVYQQQGRLITDSDWNELVDTVKARMDDALVDVIGAGSPKTGAAGIQMSTSSTAPKIVPGTVYAGGVEARVVPLPGVSSPFNFNQQADFPAPPPLPAAGTAYRIYADVWDRPVGALEDDGLRDPALHGADTCTRTQIMAQVKWSPATKNPESPSDNPTQGDAHVTIKYPSGGSQTTADACDPKAQEVDPVGGDFLFRVEVHDARWPAGSAPSAPDRVVVKWSRENGAEQYAFADMPDWFTTGPWTYELHDVDSERHLGFHLATTSWTPKRGSLTTTLPQNPPAGTMVRRWEGYLVLVRSGGVAWAVSTANGEKAADTAPGATVQFNDGVMTVSLADLEFSLEVVNRVFLPGDFWSAPVRRATYQAGKELLKNALPSGIVHRYVTLAEVLTTNLLKVRTAQEQRKLAFPRLTELDAGDMGYSTTCTSGLFDNTHDTVKKALDRLCAINGSHVGYTKPSDTSVFKGNNPTTVKTALDLLANVTSDDIGYATTCTSGLFDNTHDTVEKALNRLCAINATHVGFTKPADTSVFKGATPTTVAQAMNLLADVKSQQISYTATSNSAIHDVRAALDELYARPVQNGSRVYIGPAGQYATINVAINDLVAQGKKDIALALLPGDHSLSVNWNQADFSDVNLSILGLDRAARLIVSTNSVSFNTFNSVQLRNLHLILDNTIIQFVFCQEVVLTGNIIESSKLSNRALIQLNRVKRVVIQDNLIDSQWETADSFVVNILGLDAFENITELFIVGLNEFKSRCRALAQTLFNLPAATRTPLGNGIKNRQQNVNTLTFDERSAYNAIGDLLLAPGSQPTFLDLFVYHMEYLRYLLYIRNPGTSILYNSYMGPMTIKNNHIRGLIGYMELPKANNHLTNQRIGFLGWSQSGKASMTEPRHTLEISGNVMAGIRFGETTMNNIRTGIQNSATLTLPGAYRVMNVTDNIIENEDNYFLAMEVNFQGNQFTFHPYIDPIAGFVIAQTATYLNNRARTGNSALFNGVGGSSNILDNGNFRVNVVSFIIT